MRCCCFKPLITVGRSQEEFFLGYWYFLWSIFPLLLGAGTGNVSQGFFKTFSEGSQPWPCSLISKLSIVRVLQTANTPLTENCRMVPLKGRGVVSLLVCANRLRNGLVPVLTKAILQLAKAAAMCTAGHYHASPHPPSHPFCYCKTYLQNGLCQLITCRGIPRTQPMLGHCMGTLCLWELLLKMQKQLGRSGGMLPQVTFEAILGHTVTSIQEH